MKLTVQNVCTAKNITNMQKFINRAVLSETQKRKQGLEYLAPDSETGKPEVKIKGTKTRNLMADQMGISTGQVSRYEDVEKRGSEKVMEMLMRDEIDLSTAEKLSKLPNEEQDEVVAQSGGKKKLLYDR